MHTAKVFPIMYQLMSDPYLQKQREATPNKIIKHIHTKMAASTENYRDKEQPLISRQTQNHPNTQNYMAATDISGQIIAKIVYKDEHTGRTIKRNISLL